MLSKIIRIKLFSKNVIVGLVKTTEMNVITYKVDIIYYLIQIILTAV